MSISRTQYETIMYHYDQIRMKNERLYEERTEQIAREIPEMKKLQQELLNLSFDEARRSLLHPESCDQDMAVYKEKMQDIIQKKAKLLVEHGYPEDYLAPIYTCKDCKDTGYIGTAPCHCFQQQKAMQLYLNSNLKNNIQIDTFENFNPDFYDDKILDKDVQTTARENILKVKENCLSFIEHFMDAYDNLIFYGPTGAGKTFLTHCIAKELMDKGHTVVYLTSLELFAMLEKKKFEHGEASDSVTDQLSYLLYCDLLIVDDLGTEMTNSFTNSQLYYLVEERFLRHLPIIFSTNLSFSEMHARYGERLFSRFTGYYSFYKIIGDDIRQKKRFH